MAPEVFTTLQSVHVLNLTNHIFSFSHYSLPHTIWHVAHGNLHPPVSRHHRGIQSVRWRYHSSVSSSRSLDALCAAAEESVCEKHPCICVLQLHPWESWQRVGDLWPLCQHTPVSLHLSPDVLVCLRMFVVVVAHKKHHEKTTWNTFFVVIWSEIIKFGCTYASSSFKMNVNQPSV